MVIEDVKNTYIHSSSRLISAIGVSNLAIIDTKDALLIADKKYAQKITKIVEKFGLSPEIEHHLLGQFEQRMPDQRSQQFSLQQELQR